jgi:hypothetical protein
MHIFTMKYSCLPIILAALSLPLCATSTTGDLIEKQILLNMDSDIASGPTRMGGQFSLTGQGTTGYFIGNPNTLNRADRVVMTFDVTSLLRNASKIKYATLVFHQDYFFGPDKTREISVVVFNGQLSELTEESLSSSEVKPVTTLKVSSADQNQGGIAKGNGYGIDVTKLLLEKIKTGGLTISFRMEDVKTEKEGNPNMEPEGITIDRRPGFQPILLVQMQR